MGDWLRVMCSCQPALGHYLPMLGMAAALQHAGHLVTFVTAKEFVARFGDDGFSTRPAGENLSIAAGRVFQAHPEVASLTPLGVREFAFEQIFGGELLGARFEAVYRAGAHLRPTRYRATPRSWPRPSLRRCWAARTCASATA